MSVTYTTIDGELLHENRGGVETYYLADPLGSVIECHDVNGNTISQTWYWPYGEIKFYQLDGKGSTVALVDSSSTVTDSFDYSYFGEIIARSGTTPTPCEWTSALGTYTPQGPPEDFPEIISLEQGLAAGTIKWSPVLGSTITLPPLLGPPPTLLLPPFGSWPFGVIIVVTPPSYGGGHGIGAPAPPPVPRPGPPPGGPPSPVPRPVPTPIPGPAPGPIGGGGSADGCASFSIPIIAFEEIGLTFSIDIETCVTCYDTSCCRPPARAHQCGSISIGASVDLGLPAELLDKLLHLGETLISIEEGLDSLEYIIGGLLNQVPACASPKKGCPKPSFKESFKACVAICLLDAQCSACYTSDGSCHSCGAWLGSFCGFPSISVGVDVGIDWCG